MRGRFSGRWADFNASGVRLAASVCVFSFTGAELLGLPCGHL